MSEKISYCDQNIVALPCNKLTMVFNQTCHYNVFLKLTLFLRVTIDFKGTKPVLRSLYLLRWSRYVKGFWDSHVFNIFHNSSLLDLVLFELSPIHNTKVFSKDSI